MRSGRTSACHRAKADSLAKIITVIELLFETAAGFTFCLKQISTNRLGFL